MEFKDKYIKITDETILSFYKENTGLDFVAMNHIFINILNSLSTNLSENMNTTMMSKIFSLVNDIHSNLNVIKSDIIIKFHESKKEYIEDLKTLFSNSSLTNNEKINTLIEKNNDALLTKTTLLVNDIIPKNQEKNYLQIENCIKSFCSSITKDTTRLLELNTKDDSNIDDIIDNIDTQFSKMITTLQQPIFSFIQSSEERTNSGIQNVKDNLITQQSINQNVNNQTSTMTTTTSNKTHLVRME